MPRSLYQLSVRFFGHEKYQILTSELCYPVKPLDEKLYLHETCPKYLCKNEIPCQAVFNEIFLDPIPNDLKDFKKLEKFLIFKGILFKKIAIIHGKGNFF